MKVFLFALLVATAAAMGTVNPAQKSAGASCTGNAECESQQCKSLPIVGGRCTMADWAKHIPTMPTGTGLDDAVSSAKDAAAAVAKTAADAAKVAVKAAADNAAAAQIDMETKKAALKTVYDNCQADPTSCGNALTNATNLYKAKKAEFDTLTNTLKTKGKEHADKVKTEMTDKAGAVQLKLDDAQSKLATASAQNKDKIEIYIKMLKEQRTALLGNVEKAKQMATKEMMDQGVGAVTKKLGEGMTMDQIKALATSQTGNFANLGIDDAMWAKMQDRIKTNAVTAKMGGCIKSAALCFDDAKAAGVAAGETFSAKTENWKTEVQSRVKDGAARNALSRLGNNASDYKNNIKAVKASFKAAAGASYDVKFEGSGKDLKDIKDACDKGAVVAYTDCRVAAAADLNAKKACATAAVDSANALTGEVRTNPMDVTERKGVLVKAKVGDILKDIPAGTSIETYIKNNPDKVTETGDLVEGLENEATPANRQFNSPKITKDLLVKKMKKMMNRKASEGHFDCCQANGCTLTTGTAESRSAAFKTCGEQAKKKIKDLRGSTKAVSKKEFLEAIKKGAEANAGDMLPACFASVKSEKTNAAEVKTGLKGCFTKYKQVHKEAGLPEEGGRVAILEGVKGKIEHLLSNCVDKSKSSDFGDINSGTAFGAACKKLLDCTSDASTCIQKIKDKFTAAGVPPSVDAKAVKKMLVHARDAAKGIFKKTELKKKIKVLIELAGENKAFFAGKKAKLMAKVKAMINKARTDQGCDGEVTIKDDDLILADSPTGEVQASLNFDTTSCKKCTAATKDVRGDDKTVEAEITHKLATNFPSEKAELAAVMNTRRLTGARRLTASVDDLSASQESGDASPEEPKADDKSSGGNALVIGAAIGGVVVLVAAVALMFTLRTSKK